MSKLPFHRPSDVISPNKGWVAVYGTLVCFCGLSAEVAGWLFVDMIVEVEPNEFSVPNEVDGDFIGDRVPDRSFCSLRLSSFAGLFCSFRIPSFVGERDDLPMGLRYLSWLVRTLSCGGTCLVPSSAPA